MAGEKKGVADRAAEAGVAAETEGAAAIASAADPANEDEIKSLIYTVRGVQVMLDSDLARLYGVETKVFNQAVSRNAKRFPERYRFRLTSEEHESLRSQIVTSNGNGRGGRRYMPYVFTEQGVSMLASVLRSDIAIEVSMRIIDAFVEMRRFIAGNAAMLERIGAVELRQLEYQRATDERFERIFDYMEAREAPRQKVFFDGQVYDAFELLVSLVRRAERSVVLVDGYVDVGTLNILAKKADGVGAEIWTRPDARLTRLDVDAFNAQYPRLSVERTTAFHDRFLILDDAEGYLVGASLKDAGKKCFAIARIEDAEAVAAVLARLRR